MNKKINYNIFTAGIVSVIITALLVMGVYYPFFEKQAINNLKNSVQTVAKAVDILNDYSSINQFADENIRFTVVAQDGAVIFDNKVNIIIMENHLDRREIDSALKSGCGQSIRKSKTLNKGTFYYAVRLESGDILRAGLQKDNILGEYFKSFYYIIIITAVIITVLFFVSRKLAKRIVQPIEKMGSSLDAISQKDIPYEELKPFEQKIKEQKEKQKQVDKIKRQFTANVSHELKTPLTSIMGYAELIEKDIAKGDDVKKFAATIRSETNRLINLTGDIIQLSQLDEWEEGESAAESVDLYICAQKCLNALSLKASKKNIDLILDGENASIVGNIGLIEDLIYNLTENAIRYNKENGSVTVTVKNEAHQTILSVSDTGIGIAQKYQSRIFERFYRVDKSRSKETGGTGLGLAIVKHIVEYHNGTIDLESTENVGTTITIVF